ncbi:MAG: DinB family protein [Gemmatimonadales bacterium]
MPASPSPPSPPIGRPSPDEFAPFYAGYVERVTEGDPLAAMVAARGETSALLDGLSDRGASHRYAPGKWSVKEIVGHLGDVERVMAYRALRIARGDETPLAGFDENVYVPAGRFDARPLGDLVRELGAVREASLALFRSFDADAWRRRGTANGKTVSVRALAYIIPGHERHHGQILRERYGIGGREGR